jgi:hypothetical protein
MLVSLDTHISENDRPRNPACSLTGCPAEDLDRFGVYVNESITSKNIWATAHWRKK